jgi:formylglycine-generating enzyme required for sulfatase activity
MRWPEHVVREGSWWRNAIDGSLMALIEAPSGRYLIDRTAVSNARFRRFPEAAALREQDDDPLVLGQDGFPSNYPDVAAWDAYPAVLVSHHAAVRYAEWCGGVLPTVAEWRYAAYGPEPHPYPWGDDWGTGPCQSAERALGRELTPHEREVWQSHPEYFETTRPPTAPVDSFPEGAGPFGLLGCIGNVHEWCMDDPNDHRDAYAPAMGGCYAWFASDLVADRILVRSPKELTATTSGFRCAIRLDPRMQP